MKTLEQYLLDNMENGVIDHNLRAVRGPNGEVDFYIHPTVVSGDTLDMTVNGNGVSPIPGNHGAGSRPYQ